MNAEPSNTSITFKLGLIAIVAIIGYAIYSGVKPKSASLSPKEGFKVEFMESAVPGSGTANSPTEQPAANTENSQPVEQVVSPTNMPTAPTAPVQQASQTGLMLDANGDGYQDTRYWDMDTNGDGQIDIRYFDTNLNGLIDQTFVFNPSYPNGKVWCYDANEDGILDFWGWDVNNDNRVDNWAWDLNRNNRFDAWGVDDNGDGTADRYSYDYNEDNVLDPYRGY